MAMQTDSSSISSRVAYLDDRIGYADFEVKRNRRWGRLMVEISEEKYEKAEQWEEEKSRCERERDELFGALRA